MERSIDSFRVGDVKNLGQFAVSPGEVADWGRAQRPHERAPAGSGPCPAPILVNRAVSRLAHGFGADAREIHHVGRPRVWVPTAIGAPVTCTATVDHRSRGAGGETYLTVKVELHGARGATLLSFEATLELPPAPRPCLIRYAA